MNMDSTKKIGFTSLLATIKVKLSDRQSIMSGAASFFLGMCSLTDGINPFGTAMLCAAGKKLTAFYAGAVLSSVFSGGMCFPMIIVNTFVYSTKRFLELKKPLSPSRRIFIASIAAVIIAAIRYILSSRLYYNLAESIVFSATLPLFTVLYMGLNKKDAFLGKGHREAALLATAFSLTIIMSTATIGDFSLGVVWAVALTLIAAKRGMAAGCLTGFVCGLGCFDMLSLPMLGLCGLTAGLLFQTNRKTAIISGCGVALIFAAVVSDVPKFLMLIFCIMLGTGLFLLAERVSVEAFLFPDEVKANSYLSVTEDPRFEKIAAAFSTLSTVFFNACETDTAKAEQISLPLRCCNSCDGCSENGLDEYENNLKLSQLLRGERSKMPTHFKELCPHAAEIETIMAEAKKETLSSSALRKIAEHYLDFSKIMECVAERESERVKVLPEKTTAVNAALDELGIVAEKVQVTGGRRRTVEIFDVKPDTISCTSSRLRYVLSKAVGTMLSEPSFAMTEDKTILKLETIPAVAIEYAQACYAKSSEHINGDTLSVFETDDSRFYALISDGMGSGTAAASCSRLTAIFLEKLLQMGAEKGECIKLLNKLLIAKEEEIFAGVDLVEIDKITATASIVKAGAAPTLLIRENTAHLIKSNTPPAGIIDKVEAEQTKIRLKRNDLLLMFSDGVINSSDEIPNWMLTIIESGKYITASELAMRIADSAKRSYSCCDDMSVIALRVV
ncbi:MAG: hypothetical protein A2Y17_04560 [Clostridiales bacterium GWF2_38_85]|nr:MAG: hypothetical protein A2Y17_04560 [Clostridiales bacterium GWF2_38_85]HBL85444.1 hypothetical protein [Clostridiales bacterium]